MKNKIKIFFSLFLFSLIFSNFFINIKGVSNVNYVFKQNTLLDIDKPSFDQEFNLRDFSFFQQRYNATYGFLNDTIGNNPNGWSITETGGNVSVFGLLDDHRQIVKLDDISDTARVEMKNNFVSSQTSGIIEFWINAENATKLFQFVSESSTIRGINARIQDDKIQYFYGAALHDATNGLIRNNDWYHIKMIFDTTPDTYDFYLNGSLLDSDIPFENVLPDLDNLRLISNNAEVNYITYIDAVGYSWDNFYSVGNNLIPILETRPLRKQVDRAEFSLKNPNEFYLSSDINLDGFDKITTSDGLVALIQDDNDVNDRILSISVQDGGDTAGIDRDNLGLTGMNFINTKAEIITQEFSGAGGGRFKIIIYDIDDFVVGGFGFDMRDSNTFNIDSRQSGGWITIAFGMNSLDIMEIDHYIDYEIYKQITDIYINSTFINRTITDMAIGGKSGFNRIQVDLSISAIPGSVNLDSLGVYAQGNPITEGLGYGVVSIGSEWRVKTYNLFTKKINGFVHIASTEGFYQVEHFPDTFEQIEPFQELLNVSEFKNVYFSGASTNDNFSFVFTINTSDTSELFSDFSLSKLLIEGVSLNQDLNVYTLNFAIGNLSEHENFFFVENSQLKFTHTSNNDSQLQFIKATFIIDNFLTEQKGISFKSQITNSRAEGNFTVQFTSGFQNIPLSVLSSTQRLLLTDSKTVSQFRILITDNNNNNITGITTGFVSNIFIYPTTDILDTALILNLLTMLIPIIIILLPTIALRDLYGRVVVMPIFLLMTIILVLGGLIPLWLIFIILMATSLFILKKNERFKE